MKSYYRVMLGRASIHADECFAGGYIGTGFGIEVDLTSKLYENWRDFNHEFIPVFLSIRPDKTRVAAGLACGAIWTVSRGIAIGDAILSPDGSGNYRLGHVSGDYYYQADGPLQHRRPVAWTSTYIPRVEMSQGLRNSAGSIGTVSNISRHRDEIERLIVAAGSPDIPGALAIATISETIEDLANFALEKHLEDFLVANWAQTELGIDYDIYMDDGERVGQQYPTDTGPLDILAISKDKKTLLVVELKKGRASDSVVGQVQRYMGFVLQELAESGQTVRGAIIALEDDQRIRRALAVAPNIDFFRYQISFKLTKN